MSRMALKALGVITESSDRDFLLRRIFFLPKRLMKFEYDGLLGYCFKLALIRVIQRRRI